LQVRASITFANEHVRDMGLRSLWMSLGEITFGIAGCDDEEPFDICTPPLMLGYRCLG